MQINFSNENKAKKYLLNIVNALNSAEAILKPSCKELEVNVAFVSSSQIKKLNMKQRNVNKVTDVLSFPTLLLNETSPIEKRINKKNYPFDINPQTGNIIIGDIVICISKCIKQAKQFQNSITREVCYLCTHGFLHLMGYDHMENDDKQLMRKLEEEVMNSIGLTK